MRTPLIIIIGLFMLLPCKAQLTKEQQEFCISTFQSFLNADEELIQDREKLFLLNLKHSGSKKDKAWFRKNIAHVDSIMQQSIKLIKQNESKKVLDILDSELYNIYGHPKNDTYNCWQLHSVLALLYSIHIKDDKEFYTKTASLAEFSRLQIEAVQANWKELHPLYKQVLNELIQIYEALGNNSKKAEIEKLQ